MTNRKESGGLVQTNMIVESNHFDNELPAELLQLVVGNNDTALTRFYDHDIVGLEWKQSPTELEGRHHDSPAQERQSAKVAGAPPSWSLPANYL